MPVRSSIALLTLAVLVAPPLSAASPADDDAPARIQALLVQLRDGHEDDRSRACVELREMGPRAAAAVPDLVAALGDRSSNAFGARESAGSALTYIAPNDPRVIAALNAALADPDKDTRERITDCIARATPPIKQCLPALIQLLKTETGYQRGFVAHAIGRFGPDAAVAVPALIDVLSDPDSKSGAIGALGDIGPAAKSARPALLALLAKPDDSRQYIPLALLHMGGMGPADIAALLSATQDAKPPPRLTAMFALGRMNYDRAKLPAFVLPLKQADQNLRDAFLLGQAQAIDPNGEKAFLALLDGINNSDAQVQELARTMAAEAGEKNLPALLSAIDSPDYRRRQNAICELPKLSWFPQFPGITFSPPNPQVVAALCRHLEDPEPGVRGSAAIFLGKIRPTSIPPEVLKAAKSPDWDVRADVTFSLAGIRGNDQTRQAAVAELIVLMKDENRWVRYSAIFNLRGFHSAARNAVPQLIAALSDNDDRALVIPLPPRPLTPDEKASLANVLPFMQKTRVSSVAVPALGDIGPDARAAVPALTRLLKSGNDHYVIDALGQIGVDAAPAVPLIAAKLGDEKTCTYAIDALSRIPGPGTTALLEAHWSKSVKYDYSVAGELGRSGRAATPALLAALGTNDLERRAYIIDILGKMGPRADGAIPALVKLAGTPDANIGATLNVLAKIGPAGISALINLLPESSASTQILIIDILGQTEPPAAAAIPELVKCLKSSNEEVSDHAGTAIASIQKRRISGGKP